MPAVIGVIGGTGKEGSALALRWALSGHRVVLGSREPARAQEKARELSARAGKPVQVEGASNEEAARQGEVVVVTVPYAAHGDTLRALAPVVAGKVVLDVTVPIDPKAPSQVRLPSGGAAALEAQALLGPSVRVVSGLHHVSHTRLESGADPIEEGDVLVCGDDEAAVQQVLGLVAELGLRGVNAGKLKNAVALEALTPVLLHINKTYKIKGAGLKLTGLPERHG